jgi:epoxyqueuosine reductase
LQGARSVIVIAVPQPIVQLDFVWNGRTHPVIIPPTYDYGIDSDVATTLNGAFAVSAYHAARAALPVKLLAARSGLGKYGKNNITYFPDRGSFCRLMAFYTDMPCENDSWQEAAPLERCEHCRACFTACPTGAILPDRFLIRAERCLTFLNESKRDFLSWVDPKWHHALIGCMRCQLACPENISVAGNVRVQDSFAEEETVAILRRTPFDRLPVETQAKVKRVYLAGDYVVICRNLALLLNRDEATSAGP